MKRYIKSATQDWETLTSRLNYDSIYEDTDAGSEISAICGEVERELGVYLEPSIQAGQGSIVIRDLHRGLGVADSIDYETFNDGVIELAWDSKSEEEFKSEYKKYLEQTIADNPLEY